jgi:hypothetical protein
MKRDSLASACLLASAALLPPSALASGLERTVRERPSFFDLEAAIGKVAEDVLDAWERK